MSIEDLKRQAAERAVEREVRPGMNLGLGTGSTVKHALHALGRKLRDSTLKEIKGVPTSEETARLARELGIPLVELHEVDRLDVTIDGADEIDPGLDLIKGLGGALLREKMVAQATDRLVIIADESKRVRRLGTKAPLPIEIVPFGWQVQLRFLESMGGQPELRHADDSPYHTDNGNFIIDCRFAPAIEASAELARALCERAGIVDHGLFLGLAAVAYIASDVEVSVLEHSRF